MGHHDLINSRKILEKYNYLIKSYIYCKLYIVMYFILIHFQVYSIVLLSLGIDKLNFLNRFTIILHNAIPIIIPMIISSGLLCLITALIGLIGLIKQKQCIALIVSNI